MLQILHTKRKINKFKMSSLRIIGYVIPRDIVISSTRHIISGCPWISVRHKCYKRSLSVGIRSSTVLQVPAATMATTNSCSSAQPSTPCEKRITIDNMNHCIKVMEYAVRGPLVIRASEIEKELEKVSYVSFYMS